MEESLSILSALAHEGRLAVLRLLMRRAPQAVRAGEIAVALGLKLNTLSVHVGALDRAGLVTAERHGREIRYRARPEAIGALTRFLVADCCRGRPDHSAPAKPQAALNVLFVCSGNSARSIMAESLLRATGGGRFRAWSAGAAPRPAANPGALALVRAAGHATDGLYPKSWDRFRDPDAPRMDLVVTVCDRTANIDGPPWPGDPVCTHWSLPAPGDPGLTPEARAERLSEIFVTLSRRIAALVSLPTPVSRHNLQQAVDAAAFL